jgi:hypothetical protein
MRVYRRLLAFLRPHAWRMGGNVGFNIVAAVLDGLAFTLLIPFLNTLFGLPPQVPAGMGCPMSVPVLAQRSGQREISLLFQTPRSGF